MAYTDDYVKTNWVNKPATNTPINQTNLNHMEQGIKNNCGRVANLSTTKAEQSDLLVSFKNVTFDSTTGVFTFTKFDNTTITVNTDLEKLAVNFDYDDDPTSPHYQNLVITLSDGTIKYADLSALVTQYEFTNTSTISFTIGTGGVITANVIDGSITADKLQPNFLADCQAAKTDAENAANAAESDALVAEGYAKGTQNGQAVGPDSEYYKNNAEYFKNQAAQIVNQSLAGLNDVTISAPTNGQILKYNAATQKWENTDETVGIAPDNVSGIGVVAGDGTLTVKWSDPNDTVVEGQTICTWAKTKLVLKTGSYPNNEDDGTVVVTNSVRNQYATNGYVITGLTNGTTYYFQLFPISDGNAVNRNTANRGSGVPSAGVTVTLTIHGAKEDSIIIKDGQNRTVGTCIFSSGQTSGTCQISVPTSGGLYEFISSVAKDTASGTNDYKKTVTLTSNATQTVNLFPDNAIYWYGREIVTISGGVREGYGSVTKNTNSITITGTYVSGLHFGRAWIYNTLDFTNVNVVNVMVDSIYSTLPSRDSNIRLGKGSGFSATTEGTFTNDTYYQNTSGRVKMVFNASGVSGSGQFVYYINPTGNSGETHTLTVKITQIICE